MNFHFCTTSKIILLDRFEQVQVPSFSSLFIVLFLYTTLMTSCSTFTYNSSFGTFGDLDLYSNVSANQSTPLVVYIHGGAWRTEDKQDHKQLALDFVEQGFTVAVTNYR